MRFTRIPVTIAMAILLLGMACQTRAPERATKVGYTLREWSDPDRRNWQGDGVWPLPAAL